MAKKCFLCNSGDSVIDFNNKTFENCSLKLAFRKIIVYYATREKKIYFASVKFDARAKRG